MDAVAEGQLTLRNYTFLHQVWGQLAACEKVLKPTENVFCKRFHATCHSAFPDHPQEQISERSTAFLVDFFGWLDRTATHDVRHHYLVQTFPRPTRHSIHTKYIYIYTHTHIHVRVYIHVCMYVCMYVCTYICIN